MSTNFALRSEVTKPPKWEQSIQISKFPEKVEEHYTTNCNYNYDSKQPPKIRFKDIDDKFKEINSYDINKVLEEPDDICNNDYDNDENTKYQADILNNNSLMTTKRDMSTSRRTSNNRYEYRKSKTHRIRNSECKSRNSLQNYIDVQCENAEIRPSKFFNNNGLALSIADPYTNTNAKNRSSKKLHGIPEYVD